MTAMTSLEGAKPMMADIVSEEGAHWRWAALLSEQLKRRR